MLANIILLVMGALVTIVGLLMIFYQMSHVTWTNPPQRKVQINRQGLTLQTTYPGLVVLAIGAALLIAGATV